MSDLCAVISEDPRREEWAANGAALLKGSSAQREKHCFSIGRLSVCAIEFAPLVIASDEAGALILLGELFRGPDFLPLRGPSSARSAEFRATLLRALRDQGTDFLARLDGEFVLIAADRGQVLIANDRFGAIPLYWTHTPHGLAFATGVRALLKLPGVSRAPDAQALKESVSFGGYRLGDRTNIASVKMVPGGSIIRVDQAGQAQFGRYWSWKDIRVGERVPPFREAVEEVGRLWRNSIGARLEGSASPGQTLSGGLDSRAILAEAASQTPRWTAITFGVPGCDDELYAAAAAREAGADWLFHPLYSGRSPDWLDLRSSYIQETDGLIELGDLMHLETLPLQEKLLDLHLSGYIGDAVSGPTFCEVSSVEESLGKFPYYGTALGLTEAEAAALVRDLSSKLDGARPRYLLFEHKLSQSTNRWSAAWRSRFKVRRPFTDYDFFDFCQSLPDHYRTTMQLHEQWLLGAYPRFFRDIPNQKTGLPILSPPWRWQLERARRWSVRRSYPFVKKIMPSLRPRIRNFTDNDAAWRAPGIGERITSTILRQGSLCCEILGRAKVQAFLDRWTESAAAPAQAVGALYVFEKYHLELDAFLKG